MIGRSGAGLGRAGAGRPAERSKDPRATLRQLLARLRPDRIRLTAVLALGVTSVAFLVSGPKILGNATNVLFDGVVGTQLGSTRSTPSCCCGLTDRAVWPACCPG
jgi:ATP-binding cassette subfamily B multidrug efflux pump